MKEKDTEKYLEENHIFFDRNRLKNILNYCIGDDKNE